MLYQHPYRQKFVQTLAHVGLSECKRHIVRRALFPAHATRASLRRNCTCDVGAKIPCRNKVWQNVMLIEHAPLHGSGLDGGIREDKKTFEIASVAHAESRALFIRGRRAHEYCGSKHQDQ